MDPIDKDVIWRKVTHVIPELKQSEHCWDWAGVRPFRTPVRVERDKDIIWSNGQRPSKLIHNYGHGGHGISFSYPTSRLAVDLLMEALKDNQVSKSKL